MNSKNAHRIAHWFLSMAAAGCLMLILNAIDGHSRQRIAARAAGQPAGLAAPSPAWQPAAGAGDFLAAAVR